MKPEARDVVLEALRHYRSAFSLQYKERNEINAAIAAIEAARQQQQATEATFAAFDHACDDELEFLLDDILDKSEIGTDRWAKAYTLRQTLNEFRTTLRKRPDSEATP